jgi:hypothetical protein
MQPEELTTAFSSEYLASLLAKLNDICVYVAQCFDNPEAANIALGLLIGRRADFEPSLYDPLAVLSVTRQPIAYLLEHCRELFEVS